MSTCFESAGSVLHGAAGPRAVQHTEREEFLSRTAHIENLPSGKLR